MQSMTLLFHYCLKLPRLNNLHWCIGCGYFILILFPTTRVIISAWSVQETGNLFSVTLVQIVEHKEFIFDHLEAPNGQVIYNQTVFIKLNVQLYQQFIMPHKTKLTPYRHLIDSFFMLNLLPQHPVQWEVKHRKAICEVAWHLILYSTIKMHKSTTWVYLSVDVHEGAHVPAMKVYVDYQKFCSASH